MVMVVPSSKLTENDTLEMGDLCNMKNTSS